MTHSMVFILLILVSSAPLLLMPAFLAFQVRQEGRGLILVGNLILWCCVYLSVSPVVGPAIRLEPGMVFPLRPGILLCLIGWLVLFRFAVQPVKPVKSESAVQKSEVESG